MNNDASLDSLGEIRDQLSVEEGDKQYEPPLLESTENDLNSAFNQRFGTSGTLAETDPGVVAEYENSHQQSAVSPLDGAVSDARQSDPAEQVAVDLTGGELQERERFEDVDVSGVNVSEDSAQSVLQSKSDMPEGVNEVDISRVEPDNVAGYQSEVFAAEQEAEAAEEERARGIVEGGGDEILEHATSARERKSRLQSITQDVFQDPDHFVSEESDPGSGSQG